MNRHTTIIWIFRIGICVGLVPLSILKGNTLPVAIWFALLVISSFVLDKEFD